MASKKSATKKHYPVVRSMPLSGASPFAPALNEIVDVGRCLSQANRRLYRYGRYYNVKIDLEPDANQVVQVFALRDDWAVQKGFQMAYKMYLENTKEERKNMSKNQIARWEDFRCQPGVTGSETGPVLSPGGTTVRELVGQGEFATTDVVDESGAARGFTWADTTTASVYSVLAEYDKAGNAQTNPSSLVSGNEIPYGELTPDHDGFMANKLESFGDNPPYDRDGVNANGPFIRVATLDASNQNAQKLSTGFFTAPCGLVLILKSAPEVDLRNKYNLTVKAGEYKGVHAPSMLE